MNGKSGGPPPSAGGNPRGAPPLGQYGILHVIGGNDRGKQCELSKLTTNIGRGADQELVLADIAVSRRHIKLHLQPNGYRLQDLGSGNGTLVNGKRIEEVMLVDGDQIELGNTLLRFEHPPSRLQAEAPPPMVMQPQPQPYMPPPVAYAPPPPAVPQGYAPNPYGSAMAPVVPPPNLPYASAAAPVMPQPYASAAAPAVAMPPPMAPGFGQPAPPPQVSSFLVSDQSRKLAFSVLGVALLIGLGGLVVQLRAASKNPAGEGSPALEAYTAGTKHFTANDFEAASKSFQEALALAPDSPELKHYIDACKQEQAAYGHIKTGKKELEQRRYALALKAFEQVDKGSVQYDFAQQQARDARREAANIAHTEASHLKTTDQKAALARINEGLEIDPDNQALLDLKAQVISGPPPPGPTIVTPQPQPDRPKPPERERVKGPDRGKGLVKANPPDRGKGKGPDRAAPTPADDGKGRLSSNPAALSAYRDRNFAGAITAMQNFAKVNPDPARGRALSTVKDLEEIRGILDRASKIEAQNPQGAQQLYTSAVGKDRALGGALSGYLGAKVSALAPRGTAPPRGPTPVATPPKGPTPVATPPKGPTPVAGGSERDVKADRILQEAMALAKKEPQKARQRCRDVMQLYGKEVTHPKYQQAYRLYRSIKGGDDDED